MLPESALAEMYPVIMTPSHDGKYFHNYTLSLLNIVHTNAAYGLPLQVMMQRGESLITRAQQLRDHILRKQRMDAFIPD
ncbi:hypothetical protein [Neisseria sp.]